MTVSDTVLAGRACRVVDLPAFAGAALGRLPWLHRVLLENLLRRTAPGDPARDAIPGWLADGRSAAEIPFHPGRILMHDTTCGPALVDIAASRSALAEAGGDPTRLNPVLPVDVSTDHSVAVDVFGTPDALARNMEAELRRNLERYRFMKWATRALSNVTVHPPGTGIMHTINLERLATVATTETRNGTVWAVPDTLIGTDSHTPMINGIGVVAWGVGGLEAESVMFGMPVTMRVPEVVGVRLTGRLREGVLATDLALRVTSLLRTIALSGRFVEFFGPGVSTLSAGDRSVVANMAPEYGSSSGYFPIDDRTIAYLLATGRTAEHAAFVEAYARRTGLWFDPEARPVYDHVLDLDLDTVTVALAGPRRPQDLLTPDRTRAAIAPMRRADALPPTPADPVPDACVAIAAITSCTNTSDPRLLVAAGLLARKARALGLAPRGWVKTSLAPGSPTAERYLRRSGLLEDLEAIGFGIVGYGCTTCIGNSGALPAAVTQAVSARGILPVAVLSGNRNFPGRVHPQLEAGFLASPPMVIAYALAGDVDRDILQDPIAAARDGTAIHLADLWPSGREIDAAMTRAARAEDYAPAYDAAEANAVWAKLDAPATPLYPWDPASTYIRRPPFAAVTGEERLGVYRADAILVVGDDITTDHISPAGAVPAGSEAAAYLIARGEDPRDLNVFSSRRGNWEAMVRGLFTNKTVKNLIGPAIPPGSTIHAPTGDVLPLYEAAARYRAEGRSVVIVAGERYGMGSSRDWAAKGASLLGARAVLAASFERIHRSNLVNMGILPLRLPPGLHPSTLALRPGDSLEVRAPAERLAPHAPIDVTIRRAGGSTEAFAAAAAVETSLEVEVLIAGGVIPLILQRSLGAAPDRPATSAA
ncbi:Aconitate/2-methylaconitate hydratase [Methylobacterium hispanicum]|uniref:Aconitate hydratase n=1 Tax=Methylobacterium hispanicum TaxID=270350 RepID=A0AAV4ZGI2_9HYPH|nr:MULTISPECIES: aconitate hydratase AcnA [Methylobacterium]GJD87487.1 Aconitate/2-methylaconitate hydratase [Methylobacterium hispanicum]